MRRARGYTLIEVVAAFALLAMGLGLLLGILGGGVGQARWSAEASEAAQHAQTLLDTVGVGAPIEPGSLEGESGDGRFRWTLAVEEYEHEYGDEEQGVAPAGEPARGVQVLKLYKVELAMRWGAEGPRERAVFRTLRLRQVAME
ncbi:prepilin-type N-terminal cleavage/methylation domain-containing protein [Rehaibacterium terrae]|uniref:General secretion pathway protein I n=1 Tax=Rehaibacterium terrae TaxID=1341696 RepID=A0A7W7XYB5_9GAMM|nr:prepilin-type N-terminal cleavage/methylation domain-containing protein [Rehaibacterium terrae]MBB5014510.1 general secretion pathway protein I [Rehaibacterium terrae]